MKNGVLFKANRNLGLEAEKANPKLPMIIDYHL